MAAQPQSLVNRLFNHKDRINRHNKFSRISSERLEDLKNKIFNEDDKSLKVTNVRRIDEPDQVFYTAPKKRDLKEARKAHSPSSVSPNVRPTKGRSKLQPGCVIDLTDDK